MREVRPLGWNALYGIPASDSPEVPFEEVWVAWGSLELIPSNAVG